MVNDQDDNDHRTMLDLLIINLKFQKLSTGRKLNFSNTNFKSKIIVITFFIINHPGMLIHGDAIALRVAMVKSSILP